MRKKISKQTIINLIKDDLYHQHIILGMNILGFGNGDSMLNICVSVFSLMELNINDRRLEKLVDEYNDRAYHVTEMHHDDKESFERLATAIYDWLVLERKKYRKLSAKA